MVPLQHHKVPPENSEFILFLPKTCLNSASFNSFMNTGSCGEPSGKGSRVRILVSSSTTKRNSNYYRGSKDHKTF